MGLGSKTAQGLVEASHLNDRCVCGHRRGEHVLNRLTPTGGCLASVTAADICDCAEFEVTTQFTVSVIICDGNGREVEGNEWYADDRVDANRAFARLSECAARLAAETTILHVERDGR